MTLRKTVLDSLIVALVTLGVTGGVSGRRRRRRASRAHQVLEVEVWVTDPSADSRWVNLWGIMRAKNLTAHAVRTVCSISTSDALRPARLALSLGPYQAKGAHWFLGSRRVSGATLQARCQVRQ